MKKALLIFALMLTGGLAFAQFAPIAPRLAEPEVPKPKFTSKVYVVYPYLWRGIKYYGDKVVFHPCLS